MTGSGSTEFIGKVAVVEQEGKSVRVLLHEGETLYSARDILSACGMKYPTKWCQREAQAQSCVKLVKLMYPVNGRGGGASRQACPMYFTTAECGRMMLDMVGCDKSVRTWLEREVFSFKIKSKEPQAPPMQAEEKPRPIAPEMPIPPRTDDLEKMIDNLLFAVLDLKKYIAQTNA